MAVELDKRVEQVIDISKIFSDYAIMNQMADTKTDFDPVMLEKVKKAETAEGKKAPSTLPSKLIKRTDTHAGIKGLRESETTGEHESAISNKKSDFQRISSDIAHLSVLKKEDKQKYEEYKNEIAPEIRRIYRIRKDDMPPILKKKIEDNTEEHGIDLTAPERISRSYEEEKKKIGRQQILSAIKSVASLGHGKLFGRYKSAEAESKVEERLKAKHPPTPPFKIPVENK